MVLAVLMMIFRNPGNRNNLWLSEDGIKAVDEICERFMTKTSQVSIQQAKVQILFW